MATTRGISNSRLSQQFDFQFVRSQDLLPLLQTQSVDLVIFRNPSAWHRLTHLALIKLYARKLIIHEHHYSAGFEQHQVDSISRFRALLRASYQVADQVVAISRSQADWMQENHLVADYKLSVIQQCPALDRFFEVPEKTMNQPLILGAYGRFCAQKGFDLLLQAVQDIPEVQLYLGGYGQDEFQLRQLARSHVKFWGAVQDVPGFLTACDVIVIPSRWEPWGNVCVEVKAAGKPVIAAAIDGLTEQIQDCGVLVSPNDSDALATAIRAIAATPPTQLQQWGRTARASVQDAWERYLTQWETLLWQVLSS
jgi:glycosyltransferase involved in cell wall biosynthesis